MSNLKKTLFLAGAVTLVVVSTFLGKYTDSLRASTFFPEEITGLEQLELAYDEFQTRLDALLESGRPGAFDKGSCEPANSIDLLPEIGKLAIGTDEASLAEIRAFEALPNDPEIREVAIESRLASGRAIPQKLFLVWIDEYFSKFHTFFAEKLFFGAEEGATAAVSDIVAAGEELPWRAAEIRDEIDEALDFSLRFIAEEHAAASTISGLCELLKASNALRESVKEQRILFADIASHSGSNKTES